MNIWSNTTWEVNEIAANSTVASQYLWVNARQVVRLTGFVIAVSGLLGNLLCYLTAKYMPDSISVHLIKHLAFWDSMSVISDHLFPQSLHFFDISLPIRNVTC